MELYYTKITSDGRVTIPREVRARLSSSIHRDCSAVFTHDAVFMERHSNWPYVKMWVAEPGKRPWDARVPSQRSRSRLTTGRVASSIDDSYRIHIPMGFRRESGFSDAVVWVVQGEEMEIWSEQIWELAGLLCLKIDQIPLPQHELSRQVKRILESRSAFGSEAITRLDMRGRLTIPPPLRANLSEQVILAPGLDHCVALYSDRQWRELMKKLLNSGPQLKRKRGWTRIIFATAFPTNVEPSGRLVIPERLQEYMRIGREAIILNSSSCMYLWDSEMWRDLTLGE